ncbi:hypothetical protein BIV57_11865 [Mangrovactinospora gilvigrisea]|uniref:Major facilitator superfamily (MFS) profile domain-containing protein n=1 Tax=Mangrovactinospora gilvigrisea TaxID=1428644 RepID=A0A1J7BUX2_9ACTN|nr:MFS transporter [Mangrovactinospora gilvigrisea]OIV37273.1 hypothetical protein BIV57_11865 [Mangrovactinospora gilvigrisea]
MPGTHPHARRWSALAVILTAVFVTSLDFRIANVALPALRRDFHASPATLQWVIISYILIAATGFILTAKLADLYGRRRIFTLGIVTFTASSALCGFAPTAALLITGRIGQGAGAALMGPAAAITLAALFPTNDPHRARAFAWYGSIGTLAAVLGMALGGILIDANLFGLGWRTAFLVNLPIGAAAYLSRRLIPETHGHHPHDSTRTLDLTGAALLTAGLIALTLPLVQGPGLHWPLWCWLTLTASLLLLATFTHHQHRRTANGKAPLLNLDVFRQRGYPTGVLAVMIMYGTSGALGVVLVQYLQQHRHMTAAAAGAVFILINGGYWATNSAVARLLRRYGRTLPLTGAAIITGGFALLALAGPTGALWPILTGMTAIGIGQGFIDTPLYSAVLGSVAPHLDSAAAAVHATARESAGALSIALIGIVYYGAGYTASMITLAAASAALIALMLGHGRTLPHAYTAR